MIVYLQEGQRKYEEGMSALAEAQRIESEEGKRIDTINHQLNLLKMKEKEMADVRIIYISIILKHRTSSFKFLVGYISFSSSLLYIF